MIWKLGKKLWILQKWFFKQPKNSPEKKYMESEAQLLLAKRFHYVKDEDRFLKIINEIRGIILGLIKYKKCHG